MMIRIKRFGVLSVAKISGAIALIAGLFMGVLIVVMMMADPAFGVFGMGGGIFAAVLFFILFVVIYAIAGFLWGVIAAIIYNLAAGWFGGIEFENED